MKKIIAIAFATALTMFGASESFAQQGGNRPPTVEQCAEADTRGDVICQGTANNGGVYPPRRTTTTTTTTLPEIPTVPGGEGGTVPTTEATTTTTVAPTVPAGQGGTVPRTPTGSLPRTGGSGQSGILQVGALLLVAGAVVFVAARRRNPAAAA